MVEAQGAKDRFEWVDLRGCRAKYRALAPTLTERSRRAWAATETTGSTVGLPRSRAWRTWATGRPEGRRPSPVSRGVDDPTALASPLTCRFTSRPAVDRRLACA